MRLRYDLLGLLALLLEEEEATFINKRGRDDRDSQRRVGRIILLLSVQSYDKDLFSGGCLVHIEKLPSESLKSLEQLSELLSMDKPTLDIYLLSTPPPLATEMNNLQLSTLLASRERKLCLPIAGVIRDGFCRKDCEDSEESSSSSLLLQTDIEAKEDPKVRIYYVHCVHTFVHSMYVVKST